MCVGLSVVGLYHVGLHKFLSFVCKCKFQAGYPHQIKQMAEWVYNGMTKKKLDTYHCGLCWVEPFNMVRL